MKTVALGEVVEIVSGATPKTDVADYWGGDVPWATPADLSRLDGPYISATPRTLTEQGLRSCATRVLPAGSVLLSSRAPIGHVAINTVPMATNQGFKSLVPSEAVDAKFLYHWLKAKTDYLQSLGNGATFKELSKATAAQIQVPLPAMIQQRRIAAVLDQAELFVRKRSQVLVNLELLNSSIFREMFAGRGDPRQPLDSIVDDTDRINYGVVQPGDHVPDGVPLIRVSDLAGGHVDRTRMKCIAPSIESAYARSRIRGTEILVSCVGSIGAVSLVSEADIGSNVARAISRVPISDAVTRQYVAAFLRTDAPQRRFVTELRTVAQPTLNVKQLAATEVPIPPIDLQQEFVRRVAALQRTSALAARAAAAADALFASLQSRAFRGEL